MKTKIVDISSSKLRKKLFKIKRLMQVSKIKKIVEKTLNQNKAKNIIAINLKREILYC